MNMMDQPWLSLELPYGWEMKFDPQRKRHFFLDHINKATTWDDPRIKIWTERKAREDQILSQFPKVGKDIISMVLKSSDGDISEACAVLKEMGYEKKQTSAATSDSLFHTLSLLTRPDTLSPKSGSSVPLDSVRDALVRSSSPCSSVTKAKSSHSETNSTISNSSEEDKKKGEKKSSAVHKHNQQQQQKKKSEKKESHHGNGKAGHSSSKHDHHHHHTGLPLKHCGTSSTQTSVEQKEVEEDSKVNPNRINLRNFVSISVGPNKDLARGPDHNLLNSDRPPAYEGHNPALCSGPSPSNVCGPKKGLYKGPQAKLLSADTI